MIEQPAGVAPPEALIGRVGVQRGVAVQVVVPVAAGPLNGVALDCEHAAVSQNVLEPLGSLEAPVAQLPVVRQGDAQAACVNKPVSGGR